MEQLTPLWQPNEQECLRAILEHLIDEGVVATRQKLGLSSTCRLDDGFGTNLGVDFDGLLSAPETVRMLTDFFAFFWLVEQTSWVCLTVADPPEAGSPALSAILKDTPRRWAQNGTLVLADVMTPAVARVVCAHRARLVRVVTLLGPSVAHACAAWGLRRDQYKALVCRDTLELVEPRTRWNMIYGSRML